MQAQAFRHGFRDMHVAEGGCTGNITPKSGKVDWPGVCLGGWLARRRAAGNVVPLLVDVGARRAFGCDPGAA